MNQSLYQIIQPLSDEQRINARARAAELVLKAVGAEPRREAFINVTISKYPAWFTKFIGALMAIVFIAAGMPSLFRLFSAGRDYFLHGIDNQFQAAIVGLSTFLLAESLVVLSTIAARVYFTGRARLIFVFPVIMGLMMALVGNWTIVQPGDLFSWLETIVPPLVVLFVAFIGEKLILEALETRHANERAYQTALSSWQIAAHTPENHPHYGSILANVLRDALRSINSDGPGSGRRKELMSAFSTDHWRALVYRELQAEQWYSTPLADVPELPLLAAPEKKQRRAEPEQTAEPSQEAEPEADTPAAPFGLTLRDSEPGGRASAKAPAGPVSMPMIKPLPESANSANGNGNGSYQ